MSKDVNITIKILPSILKQFFFYSSQNLLFISNDFGRLLKTRKNTKKIKFKKNVGVERKRQRIKSDELSVCRIFCCLNFLFCLNFKTFFITMKGISILSFFEWMSEVLETIWDWVFESFLLFGSWISWNLWLRSDSFIPFSVFRPLKGRF